MLKLLFLSIVCFFGVESQLPALGKCPKIESVQQDFDLSKYLGKWYEQEKYFAVFELDGKCVTANYSLADDGTVKVLNQQIDKLTKKTKSIDGTARPAGEATEGKLLVNFNNLPYYYFVIDKCVKSVCVSFEELRRSSDTFKWVPFVFCLDSADVNGNKCSNEERTIFIEVHFDAPYWILETDYENYSVVWSCTDITIVNTRFAWILTRERNPTEEVLEKAHAVFDRFGLDRKSLHKTEQEDCHEDS